MIFMAKKGELLQWDIEPKLREVFLDGKLPYELLFTPRRSQLYGLGHVAYAPDMVTQPMTETDIRLSQEISAMTEGKIAERRDILDVRYQTALTAWKEAGEQGDAPERAPLVDNTLVRVIPERVQRIVADDNEEGLLLLQGTCSYFGYVATRELGLGFPNYLIDNPLAMCGIVVAEDNVGTKWGIYTKRVKTESYPYMYHGIGGLVARPGIHFGNPVGGWLVEIEEESGVTPPEIDVLGVVGLAADRCYRHPEIMHFGLLKPKIEDVFRIVDDPYRLHPVREFDKEVEIRKVPWEADCVRALILGVKADFNDSPRPWVPTGLANLLLAAGHDEYGFGREWMNRVQGEYVEALQQRCAAD